MTILDQFDIYSHTDYSGSYTDNVFATLSGSNTLNNRKVIANKLNAVVASSSLAPYELTYSDYLNYVSGNVLGKNYGFSGFISSEETIYDSMMPSPVDYHITNGAELISNSRIISGSSILNTPTFASGTGFQIRVADSNLTTGSLIYTAGNYSGYDTHWVSSFPFEKKYNRLLRLKRISNFLVKNSTVRISDNSYVHSELLDLVPAKTSNIFTGIVGFFERNQGTVRTSGRENVLNLLTETSKSVAVSTMSRFNADRLSTLTPSTTNGLPVIAPSLVETYKMYFGIGRKKIETGHDGDDSIPLFSAGRMANFIDFNIQTVGTESNGDNRTQRLVFGVSPAGWKYGVYSGLPTNTKMIFRRNRFGQFRDVLEQRLFTKAALSKKNTISSSPVTITFISGTAAYVTATNDSTLNDRDSGIYRREYTSGKPFADI